MRHLLKGSIAGHLIDYRAGPQGPSIRLDLSTQDDEVLDVLQHDAAIRQRYGKPARSNFPGRFAPLAGAVLGFPDKDSRPRQIRLHDEFWHQDSAVAFETEAVEQVASEKLEGRVEVDGRRAHGQANQIVKAATDDFSFPAVFTICSIEVDVVVAGETINRAP